MKKINLVFLHGWLFDSSIWDDLKTDLEKNFYVKSPNFSGHINHKEKITLSELNIEGYLENEPWKNILIGYSFGGMMCIRFALENKAISKLILINSSFPSSYSEINNQEIDSLILDLEANKNEAIKRFIYKCCKDSVSQKKDFKNLMDLQTKYSNIHIETLIKGLIDIKKLRELLDNENSIGIDTLIIQGEHDSFFPPRTFDENNSNNIQHKVVKGMSHYPFLSFHNEIKKEIIKFVED